MLGRRNPFVAREGLPFLIVTAALVVVALRYADPWLALVPTVVFVLLYLLFRDPRRTGPSVALGIVSPVDGVVVAVDRIESGDLDEPVYSISIRVDSMGTYTARSPVEGRIMNSGGPSLWVQTDEGDNVLLKLLGHRLGLVPHAFARYGERLGLGQRCAYLRLTRTAEVQFPADGKVAVEAGARLVAGVDLLGSVPAPR